LIVVLIANFVEKIKSYKTLVLLVMLECCWSNNFTASDTRTWWGYRGVVMTTLKAFSAVNIGFPFKFTLIFQILWSLGLVVILPTHHRCRFLWFCSLLLGFDFFNFTWSKITL